MAFTLPDLPYSFDALEPHFDARTMEIHHDKHHAAYVSKLNAAIDGSGFESKSIEDLLAHIKALPADKQGPIRNNGGGHYNHTLFWTLLSPSETSPSDALSQAIISSFGSMDAFKSAFNDAAATRFGSGWAWLIKTADGSLAVTSTANQDNPLMDVVEEQGMPLLGLDVWEHAYYLHYQNRRPDYISAFWNLVNWDVVSKRFSS